MLLVNYFKATRDHRKGLLVDQFFELMCDEMEYIAKRSTVETLLVGAIGLSD